MLWLLSSERTGLLLSRAMGLFNGSTVVHDKPKAAATLPRNRVIPSVLPEAQSRNVYKGSLS